MLASVLGKPSAKKFGGGGTVKFSFFEVSRENCIPRLKEVGKMKDTRAKEHCTSL